MSMEVANATRSFGQFASNNGYSQLIAAAQAYPVLKQFFNEGVTEEVDQAVKELQHLAKEDKAEGVSSTASTLAVLIKGQPIAVIHDGMENDEEFGKQGQHTGVMVAYMLPLDVAHKLALKSPDAEKPEDMHITVAYFGKGLQPAQVALVKAACAQLAKEYAPIKGELGGLGRFPASKTSEDREVHVKLADVPRLESLREKLLDILRPENILVSSDHGFTPHVTLAYTEPNTELDLPEGSFPITVDGLTVVQGDNQWGYFLHGDKVFKAQSGWVGVDLDGTLAEHVPHEDKHFDPLKIGAPIPKMVKRVKGWLKDGHPGQDGLAPTKDIRILTARVADDPDGKVKQAIQDWTEQNLGQRLPVTNEKNPHMIQLYDDKATHVERNTGVLKGVERLRGALDIGLSATGKRQAQELADQVKKKGGFDRIISSSKKRSVQTVQPMADATNVIPVPWLSLHTRRWGSLEGKPVEGPDGVLQDMTYYTTHPNKRPPGKNEDGETAETQNEFTKRVIPPFKDVLSWAAANPDKSVYVNTHGRVIKAWKAWIKNGCPADNSVSLHTMLKHGKSRSMRRVELDDDGVPKKLAKFKLDKVNKIQPGVYVGPHALTPYNDGGGVNKLKFIPIRVHEQDLTGQVELDTDAFCQLTLPVNKAQRAWKVTWANGAGHNYFADETAARSYAKDVDSDAVEEVDLPPDVRLERVEEPYDNAAHPGDMPRQHWTEERPVDLASKEFNPDQPRDDHGKWTSGGGGGSSAPRDLGTLSYRERQNYLSEWSTKWNVDGYEKMAIRNYSGPDYSGINRSLRDPERAQPGVWSPTIKYLDAAIAKAPPTSEPLLVYRGLGNNTATRVEGLKPGEKFADKAYVSTSLDPAQASINFSAHRGDVGGRVIAQIEIPKGAHVGPIDGMSDLSDEQEILLGRNSSFIVTGKETKTFQSTSGVHVDTTVVKMRWEGSKPEPLLSTTGKSLDKQEPKPDRSDKWLWNDDDLVFEDDKK